MTRIGVCFGALIAATVSAQAATFDVYRAACLDTGIDLAKVRALAASQKWGALTDAERDQLAPGSRAFEGWALAKDGARYLVSISGSTAGSTAGDRSGASVVSCSVLAPKTDEKAVAKSYSAYLKRQPSEDRDPGGMVTYTWAIQDSSNVNYHYLVSGGAMSGLSLSVSAIRQ